MNLYYFLVHVYVSEIFALKSVQENLQSANKIEELAEIAINVAKNCLDSKTGNNVLAGNWTNIETNVFHKIFSSWIPVNLIDVKTVIRPRCAISKQYYENEEFIASLNNSLANNFIVFISSSIEIISILRTIEESIWWNHEGFFLLVNQNVNDVCETLNEIFHEVWKFNILSVILLCYNVRHELEFHTFNPYNSFAPINWRKIDNRQDVRCHNKNWHLFRQSINKSIDTFSAEFCKSLKFDKTRNLNGYTINMGAYVHTHLLVYYSKKTGLDRFGGVNGDITRTICNHLNAVANVKFYYEMGSIDDTGMCHGFLRDLRAGEIDYAMNMNILRKMWKQQTYPHETAGFCIVSLKRPVSFMQKFKMVFTSEVWFIFGVTLVFSLIVLNLCLKRALSVSLLHYLEMLLINSPMNIMSPSTSFKRFLLLSTIILIIFTNSFIQGRLSAILVAPNTNPTIDTLDDLLNSNLTIHGTLSNKELLADHRVTNRYKLSDYPSCIAKLERDEKVACVPGCIEARYAAYESEKYHISTHGLLNFFMAFSARKDWPLLSRFNQIIRRISEAGLIRLFRIREERYFKHNLDTDNSVAKLSLKNMRFSFILWASGLLIGSCVFVIEIAFYYFKCRIVQVLINIRR